jgi:5'-3' exonuclease
VIDIYDANNTFRRDMEQKLFHVMSQPRSAFIEAMTAKNVQIYIWDGYNHNARRRALFPGYKIREPSSEDIYSGLRFLREVLAHTPAIQIEVPEWEADDVIGVVARKYARTGHRVRVHSNDLDYFQLLDTENIELNGVNNITGAPAEYLPLYKTLVGDSSDKIPGIVGFGGKTFLAMKEYWGDMIERLSIKKPLVDLPFAPRHKAWLLDNKELLESYWEIVHLWDVPVDLIETHMINGQANEAAAEALLRKFFL